MIVVIGSLIGRLDDAGDVHPGGFVATLATSAASDGASVQVVARVGDDAAGDAVLLGLAAAGVGHVAALRDASRGTPVTSPADDNPAEDGERTLPPGPPLDAADVNLALRYLSDYRVIVVAHAPDAGVLAEAVSASSWAGAHLVVVSTAKTTSAVTMPDAGLVLSADPEADAVAARLGRYAAAVDAGSDPDTAYAVLTGATT